jgi:hypothetical protein
MKNGGVRLEEWKKTIHNNLYSVSNLGRVRNDKTGRILKPRPDNKGYCRANLQGKDFKVHRLVAECFIPNGDPENKVQVNHIDGIKSNNKVVNLEWCDNKYNVEHSFLTGMRDHLIKITNDDIINIRENSLNYKEVMLIYGLSQSHSSAIVNGTKRTLLEGKYGTRKKKAI